MIIYMGTQEIVYAPLAQLDRVFGYEPKGRGFESLTACQIKMHRVYTVHFCLVSFIDSNPMNCQRQFVWHTLW